MTLSVSSWFIDQTRASVSEPLRRFTLGGSDYSSQVLRWPAVAYRSGTIDLGTNTIRLSNIDRAFQFLVNCDLFLTTSCELSLGFTHPESGEEMISLFTGAPNHAAFDDGGTVLRLQMQGKTKRLTDTSLGTDAQSGGLDFTNSAFFPSDLAWFLVTSQGGMSTIQDDSNPDLDYSEWQAWRDANENRDVRVKGYFTGERIYQVLNTLGIMDGRVISFQNARLRFRDEYQPFGELNPVFPQEKIIHLKLSVDADRITNQFVVEADYDPGTSTFKAELTRVHSDSKNQFGRKSGRFSSRGVWFATGQDPRYLAEDQMRFKSRPHPIITIQTPFAGGIEYSLGDVISLTYSYFDIEDRNFRLTGQTVDMNEGTVNLEFVEARHRAWQFQSTVVSENLLVRNLQAVDSDTWLGIRHQVGAYRVYRSDPKGAFQPTPVFATTLLALNGQEILFGGPPSSGSTQAVLQRSSDSGSSAVIVSSLAPNINQVLDIFQVTSGTYLASTNSGAIFRSVNAGSSWNLTQTISGALGINRFFEPYSGTQWGSTTIFDSGLAEGLHIWASTDQGASWQPTHVVFSEGTYHGAGFHRITDSEHLLSHVGDPTTNQGVLRSRLTSPSSASWTTVLSHISFAHIVTNQSGHLMAGFDEEFTLNGGTIHRSFDQGSSWIEDARLAKQGNIRLVANANGTMDAYVTRMSVGPRTDHYRNYDPETIN